MIEAQIYPSPPPDALPIFPTEKHKKTKQGRKNEKRGEEGLGRGKCAGELLGPPEKEEKKNKWNTSRERGGGERGGVREEEEEREREGGGERGGGGGGGMEREGEEWREREGEEWKGREREGGRRGHRRVSIGTVHSLRTLVSMIQSAIESSFFKIALSIHDILY